MGFAFVDRIFNSFLIEYNCKKIWCRAGVAPNGDLYVGRVLDNDDYYDDEILAEAIRW